MIAPLIGVLWGVPRECRCSLRIPGATERGYLSLADLIPAVAQDVDITFLCDVDAVVEELPAMTVEAAA